MCSEEKEEVMAGETMKYYRSKKGRASYKKKLKADVKRSTSKEGLKKRAELKRARRKLKPGKNQDVAHTKNGFTVKGKSENRGSKSDMPGDKRARGGKYKK